MSYHWHCFKHLESVDIRGLAVDHPGRGKLGSLPDVHFLVLLEGVLSIKSFGINRQPAIGLADDGYWRRFQGTSFCAKM